MLSSGRKAKRCLNLKSHNEEEHSFSVPGYCLEEVKSHNSMTTNLQKRYIRQGQPYGKMEVPTSFKNVTETVN